jgi:hypothetical protein
MSDGSISKPSHVSGIGAVERRDMLSVRFDDVFPPPWSPHHEPAVIHLDEHIVRARSREVIHDLPDRTTLPRADFGMLTSSNSLPLWSTRCSIPRQPVVHENLAPAKSLRVSIDRMVIGCPQGTSSGLHFPNSDRVALALQEWLPGLETRVEELDRKLDKVLESLERAK